MYINIILTYLDKFIHSGRFDKNKTAIHNATGKVRKPDVDKLRERNFH